MHETRSYTRSKRELKRPAINLTLGNRKKAKTNKQAKESEDRTMPIQSEEVMNMQV